MKVERDKKDWLLISFADGDDVADQLRDVVLSAGESVRVAHLPAGGLTQLLEWAVQFGLAGLDLKYNWLGDAGAQVLAKAYKLTGLTSLELGGNEIGDAGARALAHASHLVSLVGLGLVANKIGDAGTEALAQASHLASLTSLELGDNWIRDAGARALAQASHLANLTSLKLGGNRIGDEGALALAQASHFASLTNLDLSDNLFNDTGARALAQASHLANLTSLELGGNQIGDEGALALAQASHFASLTNLDLSDNLFNDTGAEALAKASHLANLTSLELGGNKINAPIEALRDIQALRRHFAVREAVREQPNPLVRCMVLGAPFSGKTCIAKLLAGIAPDWGSEDRTLGQKRYRRTLTVTDRNDINELELDICDLGGQSLQFMMHGLFLRGQGLFLLVVRNLSDELGHWLDLIDASTSGQRPTIIPVINATGAECAPLIQHLEEAVAPYRTRFSIAQAVMLTFGPDVDDETGIAPLIGALRFQLKGLALKRFLQPTARMQPFVAALPQPYYRMTELIALMCNDPRLHEEYGLVRDALAGRDPPEPITPEQFAALVIAYIEDVGDISRFDFGSDHDVVVDQNAIVVVRDPQWLEHGLYSLLPPVPGENETPLIQREAFLSAVSATTPIAGLFSRSSLHPLWAEAGIKENQYTDLFRILLQPELGLILPLAKATSPRQYDYLIPAYAADLVSARPQEVGERWRALLLKALHCRVLTTDLRAPDNRILWPRYFLARAMVWLANARPNFGRQTRGTFEIIDPQGNSFRIRSSLAPNLTIELMIHQGRLWCFGFADDHGGRKASSDEEMADFGALLNIVTRELETALFHAQAGQSRLMVSLPCKSCVDRVIQDGQDPSTPLGLHDLIAPLASLDRDGVLVCPEISTHRGTINVLLRQFVDRHPAPAAATTANYSDHDVALAAMKLSVLLFMTGLATQQELTSKGASELSIDPKTWRSKLSLSGNWQTETVKDFAKRLYSRFEPIQKIAREAGVKTSGAERDIGAAIVVACRLAEHDTANFLSYWSNLKRATPKSDWLNPHYQSMEEYAFIRNYLESRR
jgi:hypothetical protein